MPKIWDIDNSREDILLRLHKAIQSVNLNFLIGSGCSCPALAPLGNIENEVREKRVEGKDEEAEKMVFNFLKPFFETYSTMMTTPDKKVAETLNNYKLFLNVVSDILFERKSNILPRQATVFSTNYDLFVEKAFEDIESPVRLNDGFNRSPLLSTLFLFSPSEFFNSIYNNGNLYNYQVQIPSINLIKMHGSLNWRAERNRIIFLANASDKLLTDYENISKDNKIADIKKFNQEFSIVLPREEKFKECILNQTYYDLLRIYANELDRENTLLVTDGFSFEDEHIYEITNRALKNPTLQIIIFCYKKDELDNYKQKFSLANNVDIIYSESAEFDFAQFISVFKGILPPMDKVTKA
jgi:hypothetical protein